MAKKGRGPAIQNGEIEGVIDFVIARAKQLQTRKFEIYLNELKPLLFGALVEADFANRIRHKMFQEFVDANIGQRFLGDRYEFELDDDIDINEQVSVSEDDLTRTETISNWPVPFIAPPWFSDLLDCCRLGDKPVLVGPKGCGKSMIAEHAIAYLGRTQYRIPIGQIMHPADLIGTKEVVSDNGTPITKFVGGLITSELDSNKKIPGGVILDEIDTANPSVGPALNNVFESGATILLQTEKGIKNFTPHPKGLIISTANTWGYGDDIGDYAGAVSQNRSTWDRLRPKMDVDYDYDIEKRIVSRYLSPQLVEALYSDDPAANKRGIVRKIRERMVDPIKKINDSLGLRPIIWCAERFKILGWNKCMYYLINEFKEEYRDVITKMITDRFGHCCVPSRNTWRKTINGKDDPTYIPSLMQDVINLGFGH